MIAGVAVIPEVASATGRPSLEPITTQALVAKVLGSRVASLWGTLSLTASLGLPDLSGASGEGPSPLSFLSGTHSAQVYYRGPDKVRVALPDGTAETDLILDGPTAWIWRSIPYSVTKVVLPRRSPDPQGAPLAPTPARLADQLLAAIGPSSAVRVSTTAYVAGRPAYQLEVSPRTPTSLVGRVVVAVDAVTGLPLRVQVVPRGARTAGLSYGFTRISYDRPAASNFDFSPPPGAKATTLDPTSALSALGPLLSGGMASLGSAILPRVLGSGWGLVMVIPASTLQTAAILGSAAPRRDVAPVRSALSSFLDSGTALGGSWGTGHLIHTALLNLLAIDNGPVLVGAVTAATLEAAAAHAS